MTVGVRSHAIGRRRVAALLVGAALLAACPLDVAHGSTPSSAAQQATTRSDPNALTSPASLLKPPEGHILSARTATRIANRVPKVRDELRQSGTTSKAFLKGDARWQVSYYRGDREVAQVLIDDRTAVVLEAWTGHQVAWSMARGYAGAFGRKVNALYVWIPLLILFVLPFIDPRRPFRLLHLDLLVLCSLSVSLAYFNRGEIDLSVPLAYPPLLYLLVRMLLAAFRPRPAPEPLKLLVPASWLIVAIVFLAGFRVGLNVTDGNVIDVGYAGVIGADRIAHGETLYDNFPSDNEHGDTYGPVNYLTYVPFELAFPWQGTWDDLPAAHAATVAFDLLTILLLFFLGRRLRGPPLGIALAYAWSTFPFTLFAANSGANDALVALLVVAALLALQRPLVRGGLAALAGLTKLAPLALAPLLASVGRDDRRARPSELLRFVVAYAAVAVLAMLPVLLWGDLATFWDRTVVYQADRGSPFSVWGLYDWQTAQDVVRLAGVAGALVVAFVPRRRDVRTVAALSAAVLIGLQLGVTNWFYLYVVWFLPAVFVVLLDRPLRERAGEQPHAETASAPTSTAPSPTTA